MFLSVLSMRRSGSLEGYKYIVKTIPRPYYNYKKLLSVETTTIKNLKVTPLQGGTYRFNIVVIHVFKEHYYFM